MLPDSGCEMKTMGMVNAPVHKGDDHAAAVARAPGPGRAGRAGTPLPHHPRRRDPYPLPDGPVARAGPHPTQIAVLVRRSPDTVRRVLKRYLAGGPDAVPHRPTWASRPTTRPAGRPSWSGSPTWTPTRSGSTVRCGRVGCWPTTWPG